MTTLNDHEVFWLARYAHNKLAPLFKEAKTVDLTTKFNIEMRFQNPDTKHQVGSIMVISHWDRGGMFQYTDNLHTKADIDKLVIKIKADIEKLKLGEPVFA